MINYILDRYYYKSRSSICIEATLCCIALPFLVTLLGAMIGKYPPDRQYFTTIFLAPWVETLFIFLPIIEILRTRSLGIKSWVIVLITAIVFGLIPPHFLVPFIGGIFLACVYIILRRFSLSQAFFYTSLVHLCANLILVSFYTILP